MMSYQKEIVRIALYRRFIWRAYGEAGKSGRSPGGLSAKDIGRQSRPFSLS